MTNQKILEQKRILNFIKHKRYSAVKTKQNPFIADLKQISSGILPLLKIFLSQITN